MTLDNREPNDDVTWYVAHAENALRDAADFLLEGLTQGSPTADELRRGRDLFATWASIEMEFAMDRKSSKLLQGMLGCSKSAADALVSGDRQAVRQAFASKPATPWVQRSTAAG